MRGVVFRGDRQVELVEVADPVPAMDEVVVEIRASGMCGSDLHRYRGPRQAARPAVGGHEPAGVVAAIGKAVPAELLGASVMVHHYVGCGRCDQCRSGWAHLCRHGATVMGQDVNGSHADYLLAPLRTLVLIPAGLSFSAAAAISCGTGTAWGALERLELNGADTLAIFGQGPVGLSATQLATAFGARVIAVDIQPQRLARSRELGATDTIDASSASVVEVIRDLTQGRGVSKSLETSGSSSAASQALYALDTWGDACFVGIGSTVEFAVRDLLPRQITAMTSWAMSLGAQERCARFVVDRGIDVDAIFTDQWSLEDAIKAYQRFDLQTSGKGVFLRSDSDG